MRGRARESGRSIRLIDRRPLIGHNTGEEGRTVGRTFLGVQDLDLFAIDVGLDLSPQRGTGPPPPR